LIEYGIGVSTSTGTTTTTSIPIIYRFDNNLTTSTMENLNLPLTEDNLIGTGLSIVGYDYNKQATTSQKNKERLFVSWYGCLAKVCLVLWNDLITINTGNAKIDHPELKYFFMTLHWLYCYPKLKTIATTFQLHEDTVGKYVWQYSEAVEALKNIKVS
jgi:hypothetical protein